MDDIFHSSPKPWCNPWQSLKKKEFLPEKNCMISGKNVYYGDYGMEDINIYCGFPMKEATKDQERATAKVTKKKSFNFGMKGHEGK